jgi:hypothetical protein
LLFFADGARPAAAGRTANTSGINSSKQQLNSGNPSTFGAFLLLFCRLDALLPFVFPS